MVSLVSFFMVVYKEHSEWGGPSIVEIAPLIPDIPPEITDQLRKLGLDMSSEVFQRIEQAGQQEAMMKDLSAVASNPSDKERFELLYLKGFWQVVKIDGVEYTFAAIAGMKEEEQIKLIEWIKNPLEKIKVWNFIKQAAIKKWQEIDTRTQAAIEQNKPLETWRANMEKKVAKYVQDIGSITNLPKVDIENLKQEALTNTPKELKWASPEEIKWGKYDNILLADYYERNEKSIVANIPNEADRKKFESSIVNIRLTLERPVPFDRLTRSIVLWSGRDQIESRGRELISSGYSRQVAWDAGTRTITFTNNLWERRVLETARIPPRERIEKNGLSISRDIPPVDTEWEKRSSLEEKQKNQRREVATDYAGLRIIPAEAFPKELRDEWVRHEELYRRFDRASTPQARYDSLTELLASTRAIEVRRREKMTPENMEELGRLENPIQDECMSLERLEASLAPYIAWERELSRYTGTPRKTDSFESIARSNLEWLTSDAILFHRMGPSASKILDRIVAEVNLWRPTGDKIILSEKGLSTADKSTLDTSYNNLITNLWFDRTVLKSADIWEFQRKIRIATNKTGIETTGSIENLIKPKSKP
jgi:hypothetical protein